MVQHPPHWGYAGIGWNMNYPFNTGDQLCCGQCAVSYLDASAKARAHAVLTLETAHGQQHPTRR